MHIQLRMPLNGHTCCGPTSIRGEHLMDDYIHWIGDPSELTQKLFCPLGRRHNCRMGTDGPQTRRLWSRNQGFGARFFFRVVWNWIENCKSRPTFCFCRGVVSLVNSQNLNEFWIGQQSSFVRGLDKAAYCDDAESHPWIRFVCHRRTIFIWIWANPAC